RTRDAQRHARGFHWYALASTFYTLMMAVLVSIGTAATSASFTYLFDGTRWTIDHVALVLIHTMLVPILLTIGNAVATLGFWRESGRPDSGRRLLIAYATVQGVLLIAWLIATTLVTTHLVALPLAQPTTGFRWHACRWLSAFPTSLVGAAAMWLACSLPILPTIVFFWKPRAR
ncbi:MAG: hypothetical protein QM770_24400, partial [Tepidisphaeraceae bacterium]